MAFLGTRISWEWQTPIRVIPPATLDQENAKSVIHVWQRLQKSPNIDLLRLPIRRWESSITRTNLLDKLIDAWIGLEAMLHIGQEQTYRASLRLAELIGKDGTDRQKIFGDVKRSYSERSRIVHGNTKKKKKKPADQKGLEDIVDYTTRFLRKALLKVLEMPDRFDPDKDKLEEAMLTRQ